MNYQNHLGIVALSATDPATPHAQPEGLGRIKLHLHCEGVGRRRRRRGGRRSLMKNSRGWSPTWPSIGKGIIGGGEAGTPPRPPLPRAPRPLPRPRPLPLPLAAGSTPAGSGGGGTRCRAATLAATVKGPWFPFSMASERKKQKQEETDDRRMRDAIPPSPSL